MRSKRVAETHEKRGPSESSHHTIYQNPILRSLYALSTGAATAVTVQHLLRVNTPINNIFCAERRYDPNNFPFSRTYSGVEHRCIAVDYITWRARVSTAANPLAEALQFAHLLRLHARPIDDFRVGAVHDVRFDDLLCHVVLAAGDNLRELLQNFTVVPEPIGLTNGIPADAPLIVSAAGLRKALAMSARARQIYAESGASEYLPSELHTHASIIRDCIVTKSLDVVGENTFEATKNARLVGFLSELNSDPKLLIESWFEELRWVVRGAASDNIAAISCLAGTAIMGYLQYPSSVPLSERYQIVLQTSKDLKSEFEQVGKHEIGRSVARAMLTEFGIVAATLGDESLLQRIADSLRDFVGLENSAISEFTRAIAASGNLHCAHVVINLWRRADARSDLIAVAKLIATMAVHAGHGAQARNVRSWMSPYLLDPIANCAILTDAIAAASEVHAAMDYIVQNF